MLSAIQRASWPAPVLLLSCIILGCSKDEHAAVEPAATLQGPIVLVDRAAESGLTFVHRSGADGTFSYPEIMSGGVCIADLDGDSDLDVYQAQGGPVPGDPGEPGRNELFLNDGTGRFRNASAGSGADHPGYGMGAFAADVDQDGDQDLLLTNTGSLVLLQNRGDATFEDISALATLEDREGFWLNAAFCDLDQDGNLDIYVANYTNWKPGSDPECTAPQGTLDYCHPRMYPGESDLLLFGRGDGSFEDVTVASGIGVEARRGMGVVALDVEQDGDIDLYVANDDQANLLWINQGDGTFRDEALIRGAALNGAGSPEGSMGVACADPDGDGDEDLLLTHITGETHTYYRNEAGFFSDATASQGLAHWSRPDTGFGIGLLDLDHDQTLDLFVASGGVAWTSSSIDKSRPYAQPDRVVRGKPGGHFPAAVAIGNDGATGTMNSSVTSRGAAFGDLNGDGLVDVVVAVRDGPLRLLLNETKTDGSWIAFRLVAKPTAALTARVRVEQLPELGVASLRPHGSYLGSSEELVRFGLGGRRDPVSVVVTWATGDQERFEGLAVNRIHPLRRGAGTVALPGTGPGTGRVVSFDQSQDPAPTTEDPAARADAVAGKSGDEAGPFPPLRFEKSGPRGRLAILDGAALAAWCERAGLPPPPATEDLDAPTWELLHPAIEAAGRTPTPETLGSVAMFYDGQGVTKSARTLYERLVRLAPEDARWWHLLGRISFDLGEPVRATEAFEKAVALAPSKAAGFARLAEAERAAGRTEASRTNWRQYVEMRPRDPYGLTGLARAEEALGNLDEALNDADAALAINPRARPALVLAARVAGRLGRLEIARQYSERAAALTNDDVPGLVDNVDLAMRAHARAVSYLQAAANHFKNAGRLKEAFEVTKLLAERRPDEAQNWQMLTWLSIRMRRGEAAIEFANTAVEVDPDFAPGWEVVARGRLANGNLESALEAADKAIAIDPSHTPGHLARGLVLGSMERFEDALAALETGLASNQEDTDGLAMKAFCQIKLGLMQEALLTVEQILELVPDHPWALGARDQLRTE